MWILLRTPHILLFPAPESSCLKNKISVHQTRVWNYFFKAEPQSTNRSLQDLWNHMYLPLLHLCTVFTSWKGLHFHPYRPLYSANSIFRNKCLTSFRKFFLICSGKIFDYLDSACLHGQYQGICLLHPFSSVSSVSQSCLTLCDPMDCSTPGLPVHHQLPESTQTHVHWVSDAI